MWIFGQVWFACLVGFGVGVLLDWLWRVRPLRRRIEELAREASSAPGRARAPEPYEHAGAPTPQAGLGHEPAGAPMSGSPMSGPRGGYPPPRPGDGLTLAELLDRPAEPDPEPEPAAEATRFVPRITEEPPPRPPAVEPGPPPPAEPTRAEPTRYVPQSAPISFDGSSEADRQYLEYLRSGGAASQSRPPEPPDESASESTTVLPAIDPAGEQPQGDGGTPVFPPAASGDDLPQRVGGDRHTEHIPFLDSAEQPGEGEAHSGQLTPIGEHGFQPFEKPLDPDEFARHDLWVGENGQLIGVAPDEPTAGSEPGPRRDIRDALNAEPQQRPRDDQRAWFAEANTAPQPAATDAGAPQHRPVWEDEPAARENRPAQHQAAETRSLFEPVIEAETGQQPNRPEQPRRQPFPPRPVRVRTGVNGSGPNGVPVPPPPTRAPSGAPGYQVGPFGPGSALPMPDGSAPSPQFRVKARTSSMVFHTEESPFYERLEPQVWFRSPEDAQRAGFTSWERPHSV